MVSANAVTALLVMPCWASRVVRVAPIMAKPKPEEMPRKRAASGADSKYGLSPFGNLARRLSSHGVVIIYRQRRVIRKPLRLVDRHAPRRCSEFGRRNLVVDAPAPVLRIRLPTVAPPGVARAGRIRAEPPVDIHPSQLVEDPAEPGALLGQEAGVLPVRAPVLEVDLPMGDVPVAAQEYLPALGCELLQVRKEVVHEPELAGLPVRAARSRRQVDGNDGKLAEVRPHVAPLGIGLLVAYAAGHTAWLAPAVEPDPAVALLLGAVEEAAETARCAHDLVEIAVLRLQLLHAHDVRALAAHPPEEVLARRRAYAIEVKRYNFHCQWTSGKSSFNSRSSRTSCASANSRPRRGACRRISSMPGCSTMVRR